MTISHFPHYRFEDYDRMLTFGTLFYSTYFVVSFPAHARIDETRRWTLGEVAKDALAVSMMSSRRP